MYVVGETLKIISQVTKTSEKTRTGNFTLLKFNRDPLAFRKDRRKKNQMASKELLRFFCF